MSVSPILRSVSPNCPYFKVMPEPFLGDPDHCSIVMINLNPGYTIGDEIVLSSTYSSVVCYKGYSEYAKPFPHLDARPHHVAGAKWWNQRKAYLDNLVTLYNGPLTASDKDRKPFAIELCPWHSHNWGEAKVRITGSIYNYVEQWTLAPALYAINHSLVDFAVVIGAAAIPVLEKNGFQLMKSFGPSKDIKGKPYARLKDNKSFPNYPQTEKKRDNVVIGLSDAEVFYKYYKKGELKVLSIFKTGSNNTPGIEYAEKGIEGEILQYIKKH